MKMAKCIIELERIYGIKKGGDRKSDGDNLNLKTTQGELAEELQISQRQLADYKKLNNLIPELQTLIENGSMKATVGYKIWAKMPQDLVIKKGIANLQHLEKGSEINKKIKKLNKSLSPTVQLLTSLSIIIGFVLLCIDTLKRIIEFLL